MPGATSLCLAFFFTREPPHGGTTEVNFVFITPDIFPTRGTVLSDALSC